MLKVLSLLIVIAAAALLLPACVLSDAAGAAIFSPDTTTSTTIHSAGVAANVEDNESYMDESGEATPLAPVSVPDQQTESATATPEPADAPPSPAEATGAEELWAALQDANYRENWSTLPRKGTLYPGQAPHGALITSYLNSAAMTAMENQPGQMPENAIILKENFTPDETLNSVTVMQKRAGFSPEYGHWFWAKYGPDGAVQAAGRVASCISCHGAVRSNDYVFSFPIAPIEVNLSSDDEAASNETPTPQPTATASTAEEAEELIANGEERYAANCAACHQGDGQGVEGTYPALAGNQFVTQADPAPVIDVILTGRGGMPAFQDQFSNEELAEVLSYIRNGWSNDAPVVQPAEVEQVRTEVGSAREPADHDQ